MQLDIGKMAKSDCGKYQLKRAEEKIYTCSCPAWRNQSTGTLRTCKHIKLFIGEEADKLRLGGILEAEKAAGTKRKAKAEDKKKAKQNPEEESKGKRKGCGPIDVLLAHSYEPEKHDVDGWLMSEKLDGVRCFWDGATMYTRNKKLFYPPKWFKALMPIEPCDGELWTKRDDF